MKALQIKVALLTVCAVIPAQALTFDVASKPLTVVTTPDLEAGTVYLFEVSGTYLYNSAGDWADAEWSLYKETPKPIKEQFYDGKPDYLDLTINEEAVDWLGGAAWQPHVYSEDHVYRYYFVGEGAPVTFQIADWQPLDSPDYTTDNTGKLTVTITAVPDGGSTLALMGGALCFLSAFWRKALRR